MSTARLGRSRVADRTPIGSALRLATLKSSASASAAAQTLGVSSSDRHEQDEREGRRSLAVSPALSCDTEGHRDVASDSD